MDCTWLLTRTQTKNDHNDHCQVKLVGRVDYQRLPPHLGNKVHKAIKYTCDIINLRYTVKKNEMVISLGRTSAFNFSGKRVLVL